MASVDREAIHLEVLAHVPTDFFHCMHCERVFAEAGVGAAVRQESRAGYPSQILDEAQRLSAWLADLSARCGERLHIRVIDPQSPEGLYKSLRHWVRTYPTFVIDGQTKVVGWDFEALERAVEGRNEDLDLE